MPFKSKSQRARFEQAVKDGKMTQEYFDRWAEGTPDKLPDRMDYSAKKIKKAKVIK